eukprot:5202628-Ditylum_brightwellii.AAC.1
MTEEDSPMTPVSDSAKKRRILSPGSNMDVDEEDNKAIPVTPEVNLGINRDKPTERKIDLTESESAGKAVDEENGGQ